MDRTLLNALEERDAEAAKRFVEGEPDPKRVLAMYHGAIRHLYWSAKDIATLVDIGRRAIDFGASHPDALKPIAYDIGSFCWPGWDEPGITIDEATFAFGAQAANLNLALAIQLSRPLSNAQWLVGAYHLAARRTTEAVASFERARDLADDEATKLLATGYIAIAHGESFATDELEALPDGTDLVAQLRTAERVFAATSRG